MICTVQTDKSDHTSRCATPPASPLSHSRKTTASTPKINVLTKTKATKTTEFEVSAPRLVPSRKHPTPISCQTSFSLPLGTARSTITTASVLLTISSVFVSMGSPVSYFDYTSPIPYCLLFISLMFSMIAMLMSGSSVIRWLHTDRHWTQEQLKQGNYFILSYLLSIVTPIFFVALSSTFCSLQLLKAAYGNGHVSVTVEAEAAVLLDV
ncbi:hypothetical protein EV424DRAFT_1541640 [Suillus variegatus]|nr:hypothetical protein EV424DRAFT_1541640 [Suillus variegatus]